MSKDTVNVPGGPPVVFGKKNTAFQAKGAAQEGSVKSDVASASSDFLTSSTEKELVPVDNIGHDTPINSIDLSDYSADDPYEDHVDHHTTRMWVEDDTFYYEEEHTDNPQSTIADALDIDVDYLDEEGTEFPDEAYDIYDEVLTEHFTGEGVKEDGSGVYVDNESMEKDYQRWSLTTSRSLEDDDVLIGNVWNEFNNVNNTLGYRIPDAVREKLSERIMNETDFKKDE